MTCPVISHNVWSQSVDWKTLPYRMKHLPRDERGLPVPWFVAWMEGKPEFRAMDPDKFILAITQNLCWVCGEKMGITKAFVAGPMCGINRTSAEPPCHKECARWSALNCPFLSNPRMVRREDEEINNALSREKAAGKMITRNPGVSMVWITREYEMFNDGNNKPLIQMGEPETVEWYANGRAATREEVQASIDSGLPLLESIARTQEGAMAELRRYVERFEKWLPAAISTAAPKK